MFVFVIFFFFKCPNHRYYFLDCSRERRMWMLLIAQHKTPLSGSRSSHTRHARLCAQHPAELSSLTVVKNSGRCWRTLKVPVRRKRVTVTARPEAREQGRRALPPLRRLCRLPAGSLLPASAPPSVPSNRNVNTQPSEMPQKGACLRPLWVPRSNSFTSSPTK